MPPAGIEIVHVGSASRDLTTDDPRGWRLGGGATYAALTTARLGLRTAAILGVDPAASTARELDLLREGVTAVSGSPVRVARQVAQIGPDAVVVAIEHRRPLRQL